MLLESNEKKRGREGGRRRREATPTDLDHATKRF
jgi:hypothetical protein